MAMTTSREDGVSNMFNIITTSRIPEVKQIQEAFEKKRLLEKQITELIRNYEDETGLAIDMIKYQRDITLPIKGPRYTALSIIMSPEEIERKSNGKETNRKDIS